jgi:hypothetical protein
MKNINIIALSACFLMHIPSHAGMVASALTYIFGDKQAAASINAYVAQANELMGTNTQCYAMNNIGKSLGLSSFTWDGATWFDDNIMQQVPDEKVVEFEATHEVSHDFYWHGLKRSAAVIIPLIVSYNIFDCCAANPLLRHTKNGAIACCLAACSLAYFSPKFELNADIKAADTLCKAGKTDVVETYCNALDELHTEQKEQAFPFAQLFPNNKTRIQKLRNILAEYSIS